jgi:Spy/CpxP family protein refolding chaperone
VKRSARPLTIAFLASSIFCLGAAAQRGPGAGGPPPPGGGRGPATPGGMGFPAGPPSNAPNGNNGSAPGGTPGSSGARNGMQLGPVGRWWDDKSVSRAIGLRQDQQQKMDVIFDANKSSILDNYKTLTTEQTKLQTLTKDPQVDKSRVFAQIDVVNQARASLQKVTTQMLLQIRAQLDADQMTKLQKVQ